MFEDRRVSPREQVYADLVAGLLDARDDPAAGRFDEELERAIAEGGLRGETATRLRFWQRASVRALVDHARVVLPTALAALETSRDDARAAAEALSRTLGEPSAVEPAHDRSTPEDPSRYIVAGLVSVPSEPRLLPS